jgi:methionyl-tRNA formyltransferase
MMYEPFEELMAREGGKELARVLPDWVAGKITSKEQDHAAATFTKKITKEDGLINLSLAANSDQTSQDARKDFLKFSAYTPWPSVYFFAQDKDGKDIRVKITAARFETAKDGASKAAPARFIIERVIPEGKQEMSYGDFERSIR